MKNLLLKFRYILLALLTVHWVSLFIYQFYSFGMSGIFLSFDVLPLCFFITASVLIAFKKKWADIFSFIIFTSYFIRLAGGFVSYCEGENLSTAKICINTLLAKLPIIWDWYEFTWLAISVIAIIFLSLCIFKKRDLKFK